MLSITLIPEKAMRLASSILPAIIRLPYPGGIMDLKDTWEKVGFDSVPYLKAHLHSKPGRGI